MPQEYSVTIPSGEVLLGWHWPVEDPKANLNIITGMEETATRYDGFAKWLNAKGISVWALDAFGQGRNAKTIEELEIWPEDAFAKTVDAIHEMNRKSAENGRATVQMGHSMGSFMTQSLIQRYPLGTDGIILMGSNGGQGALMKAGYLLSRVLVNQKNRDLPSERLTDIGIGGYARAVRDAKTPLDWLSYNEENVRSYIEDPWCGHPCTGGFWKEFLKGLSTLWDKSSMAKVSAQESILLVAGADDPVGQNGKGVRWLYNAYRAQGVGDISLKLYPMMRHEILHEDKYEKVYEDILAFILACAEKEATA